jgi:nucleoside-diphosphate-sugar epimerase
MTILVTGACGFVGLNILQHLSRAYPGTAVVAADRTLPTDEDLALLGPRANGSAYRLLDVTDRAACRRLIDMVQPTHILHAAAVTLGDDSRTATELTQAVNLGGTTNILDAAVAVGGVERCVILSSGGVYGAGGPDGACDEDDPVDPGNAYARAKRAAELAMAEREQAGGFAIAAARVGPVYGPFERRRDTRPRVSLIRRLLDFLDDGRPVRIAGPNVERDWTHAGDIARGLAALLFAPTLNHRIYNLAAGRSVSALQIVAGFAVHGLEARWVGPDEAPDLVLTPGDGRRPLGIGRLQADTGFAPQFDFFTGLADVVATTPRPAERHPMTESRT